MTRVRRSSQDVLWLQTCRQGRQTGFVRASAHIAYNHRHTTGSAGEGIVEPWKGDRDRRVQKDDV